MDSDTDKKIISAFLKGSVLGLAEEGTSAEYIQTQISHIFLYSHTVYKLYRRDNENFNALFADLSGEKRADFYKEDFFYNHYFNPAVYKKLVGVLVHDNEVILTEASSGLDWAIEMARIDAAENLTALLIHGSLKEDDFRSIGYQMTKTLAEFPRKSDTKNNWYAIMKANFEDNESFVYLADPLIKKDDTRKVLEVLKNYFENGKERFVNMTGEQLICAIDNHSDNVFYNGGEVSFIDVYLPKENWRMIDPFYAVCRLSADVLVLGGNTYAEALISGYEDYYGNDKTSRSIQLFYQLDGALIKAAYLYIIGKDSGKRLNEAEKYWQFIMSSISELK